MLIGFSIIFTIHFGGFPPIFGIHPRFNGSTPDGSFWDPSTVGGFPQSIAKSWAEEMKVSIQAEKNRVDRGWFVLSDFVVTSYLFQMDL